MAYRRLDHIDHVLERPGMYIGTPETQASAEWVEVKGRICRKDGMFSEGLLQIFREILDNAKDNVIRSRQRKVTVRKIEVEIRDDGWVSVWNDGMWIPIEIHAEEKVYNPSLIFGTLLSGSNYERGDEERMVGGLNGIGAKATNIYSREFSVECYDPENKKLFTQVFRRNMKERDDPKVMGKRGKHGYTCIRYLADFSRFGVRGYTVDQLAWMRKQVIDMAMLTNITVILNGKDITIESLADYAQLYEPGQNAALFRTANSQAVLVECTHEEFYAVSFVNGIETKMGGIHVEAWLEEILRPLLLKLNTGGKKKKKDVTLRMPNLKQYFSIFVTATVNKPRFDGQQKQVFRGPRPEVKVSKTKLAQIFKWEAFNKLEEQLRFRELQQLSKTDGKKRKVISIPGVDDANDAGGKRANQCILTICEGLSAKTFVTAGISQAEGAKARDVYGIFPVGGKILNVRNASVKKIAENKEVTNLKKILGLTHGMDYTEDKNFGTLRYGKIVILTDADHDGIHIQGLIINFFHALFPTLLQREGFLCYMRTPIVKVNIRNKITSFYDLRVAREFIREQTRKATVKYYKGLGTFERAEVRECWNKKSLVYRFDRKADSALRLAFTENLSDNRKEWLAGYQPNVSLTVGESALERVRISEFINKELIKFSIYDCSRSIPWLMDGLKTSQRKILYTCFKRNITKEIKVVQLAGSVAEITLYHHGEQNLTDTIVKMAQDFVGSNNIQLLCNDGQFGSRTAGGKDAASARYIFTKLAPLTRLIFLPEDDDLLTYLDEDGAAVEPMYYAPVIPMVLVNGIRAGIGTAYSCTVPSFHPLEIIDAVRRQIDGKKTLLILPWYRGFKGTIDCSGSGRYATRGIFNSKMIRGNTTVTVTELPIFSWTSSYREKLEKMRERKSIKSFRDNSSDVEPKFTVVLTDTGISDNEKALQLSSTLSTNNMVLFDENGKLVVYPDAGTIIEEFCRTRIILYQKRYDLLLKKLRDQLPELRNKMRFLQEVITGELVVARRPEEEVEREMGKKGYLKKDGRYRYLTDLPIRSITKEALHKLQKEIDKIEVGIKRLEATNPRGLWIEDLAQLEKSYVKIYGDDRRKKRTLKKR